MDAGVPPSCQNPQVHNAPDSPESRLLACTIPSCPEKVRAANPITYITKDDPPFLILHGTGDCLVPSTQSQLLYDALLKAGVKASLHLLPGLAHADRRFLTPENEKLLNRFIDGVLKPSGPARTAPSYGWIRAAQPPPSARWIFIRALPLTWLFTSL